MKTFILLTVIFFCGHAFGGGTVGNGGNVVVCKGRTIMLDVYEADSLRGFKIDLGNSHLSVQEKVQLGVDRLFKLDPYRASVVLTSAKTFLSETKFVRNVTLNPVDDSNEIFLPEGCERKQIAVQNNTVVGSDPFYVVNEDLWDRLDNDNKAVLILHESIYRASLDNWKSSVVRLFNSIAFSAAFDGKTQADYYTYVEGTELFKTAEAGIASDGQWYFQEITKEVGDYYPGNSTNGYFIGGGFGVPVHWDNGLAKEKASCESFSGLPIQQNDVSKVQEVSQRFKFSHNGASYRLMWAYKDDGDMHIFELNDYGGPIEKTRLGADIQADVWCKARKFPFAH